VELGGTEWLYKLRSLDSHEEIVQALLQLNGVGRKVADCVALFSLDQHDAIPVDTHVFQIAMREIDPTLAEAKSLTPTVYHRIGSGFRQRYGSHAGWAHCILFAAELSVFNGQIPVHLRPAAVPSPLKKRKGDGKLKGGKLERAVANEQPEEDTLEARAGEAKKVSKCKKKTVAKEEPLDANADDVVPRDRAAVKKQKAAAS
jgi:N-glycosylase/DNA lyase